MTTILEPGSSIPSTLESSDLIVNLLIINLSKANFTVEFVNNEGSWEKQEFAGQSEKVIKPHLKTHVWIRPPKDDKHDAYYLSGLKGGCLVARVGAEAFCVYTPESGDSMIEFNHVPVVW